VPERSLEIWIERTGCRGLVGLLVRPGYLPYGVGGWTALAEVVAEDLSDGFREKKAIKEAQQVYLKSVKKNSIV